MPIYEFSCSSCKKNFEKFVLSASDIRTIQCPHCGSKDINKIMSSFSCGCGSSGGGSSFGSGGSSGCGPSRRFG